MRITISKTLIIENESKKPKWNSKLKSSFRNDKEQTINRSTNLKKLDAFNKLLTVISIIELKFSIVDNIQYCLVCALAKGLLVMFIQTCGTR